MLFNSFTYLLFLPLVFLLHWLMPRRLRSWFLLAASYLFYMNWIPQYGALILVLTVVNYFIGLAIVRARKQKLIFIVGLCFNLGALCFFKYAVFLVDSLWSVFHFVGWQQSAQPAINILLPLGISFFTFEFIHYITDVYKGGAPIRNFKDFALFAAFFPTQIAGPIKRYQDFSKQLSNQLNFKQVDIGAGIFLIFQGLYKKIVLGDNLGAIVNYGFTHASEMPVVDTWIAVVGFTFQIFFDFSGYTDIGRGSALLLGYKVPENFNWPYLAANLTDFWRRWHMSLSTWLRDYLFIPLGGSRISSWKVRRNLLITMLLGGLWHGAAWHYVIWGGFHGLGLIVSKDWHDLVSKYTMLSNWRTTKVWHYSGVLFTLLFLFVAGIFFRANNLHDVWILCCNMIGCPQSTTLPHDVTKLLLQSTVPISILAYCLFLTMRSISSNNYFWQQFTEQVRGYWRDSPALRLATYATVVMIILGFAPGTVTPFIYFQF
jgi:alginate O-acetyltransferase complex protein AlgI